MSILPTIIILESNPLGSQAVMILLMMVIFYFILIRPQQKQRKEQETRIAALKKGDKIITIGGMHGIVHHISEKTVTLKLSEGVFVPFEKTSVQQVVKKSKSGSKEEKETPAIETTETSES